MMKNIVKNSGAESPVQLPISSSMPQESGYQMEGSQLNGLPMCCRCREAILDPFLLKLKDSYWHPSCLCCSVCHAKLTDRCFCRDEDVYCEKDFIRLFGVKCADCSGMISPTEVVRRVQSKLYHLQCFICVVCSRHMETGDEFYLRDDNKLICKRDFHGKSTTVEAQSDSDSDVSSGSAATVKRPRTTLTEEQLRMLINAYYASPRPTRPEREQICAETGLDMRVVQVWYQNRRAKDKRRNKGKGGVDVSPAPHDSKSNHSRSASPQLLSSGMKSKNGDVNIDDRYMLYSSYQQDGAYMGTSLTNSEPDWRTCNLDNIAHDGMPPNVDLAPEDIKHGDGHLSSQQYIGITNL